MDAFTAKESSPTSPRLTTAKSTDIPSRRREFGQLSNESYERIRKGLRPYIGLGACRSHYANLKNAARHAVRHVIGMNAGVLFQYHPKPMRLPKWYSVNPSLSTMPRITIVTPSFRQGPFLERTLLSVINQNYPNIEFIVQDGGSKDETVSILERYAQRLTRWESRPDRGQTHALNLGFEHATGDILAYLNSDDLLLPGSLHAAAAAFVQRPEIDAVYGHRIVIDEHDLEVGRWVLPAHDDAVLSWADYVPQETLFWRRSLWNKIGKQFDESFRFAMDWDLLLRFRSARAKIVRLPRFMGAFRVHSQSKTISQMNDQGAAEMARLRLREVGRTVTREEISRAIRRYALSQCLYDRLYRIGILRA